jgi:hypothetical protein
MKLKYSKYKSMLGVVGAITAASVISASIGTVAKDDGAVKNNTENLNGVADTQFVAPHFAQKFAFGQSD